MKVKNFFQFISEENVEHIEDIEISDGSDKELEAEVYGKESEEEESCARCGEMPQDCSWPAKTTIGQLKRIIE